jgi:hypothetical protein
MLGAAICDLLVLAGATGMPFFRFFVSLETYWNGGKQLQRELVKS